MNIERLEAVVDRYLQGDVDDDRYLYFKTYYSTESVDSIDFRDFFAKTVADRNIDLDIISQSEDEVIIQTDGKMVAVFGLSYDNWLVVYTSALPDSLRKNLGRLGDRVGWLTDAWVPSETVESLYEGYSEDRDKVTIKRRWDPYFLYRNFSSIPPEMQEYYENNLPKFEEQETEFRLRTPRWMIDDVLDSQLTEDFLQRSEVTESRFDVHLSNPGEAAVTVDKSGQVTHRSGETNATIKIVNDVLRKDEELHSEFATLVPEKEYYTTEGGMVMLDSYVPPKILRLRFPASRYNEESNIKLSNLLTVGQSDANFHGFVSGRDGREFRCHTYNTFDRSEFEIFFTEYRGDPTLYIRPIETTVDGVINLYHALKSKFDTTIERDILEETEYLGV